MPETPLSPQDVRLMQGLAQQVTALRPEVVNSDATVGELAWVWGKGHAPARTAARALYYDAGFRPFTRDLPHVKPARRSRPAAG